MSVAGPIPSPHARTHARTHARRATRVRHPHNPPYAALGVGRLGDEVLVEQLEDLVAHDLELRLDLEAVLLAELAAVVVLEADLVRGNDAPRRAARADDVLVRDREQVALLVRELLLHLRDLLHVLGHVAAEGAVKDEHERESSKQASRKETTAKQGASAQKGFSRAHNVVKLTVSAQC